VRADVYIITYVKKTIYTISIRTIYTLSDRSPWKNNKNSVALNLLPASARTVVVLTLRTWLEMDVRVIGNQHCRLEWGRQNIEAGAKPPIAA